MKKKAAILSVLIVIYMIIIFLVSSMSKIPGTGKVNISILHFPEYFILSFLLLLLFLSTENTKVKKYAFIFAISIATLYGITDELHQYFVPGRVCSLKDAFTNFIGASLVLIFIIKKNLLCKICK